MTSILTTIVALGNGGVAHSMQEAAARTITFAERSWDVRSGWGGPGPNVWSDDAGAVWINASTGALHLTAKATTARRNVSKRVFNCTEIVLPLPLGYGTYEFDVRGDDSALAQGDPNTVLGLFLYGNDTRELDIELSRWGNASRDAHNADFVNQPGTIGPNNKLFWTLPNGIAQMTYTIRWNATSVAWSARDRDAPAAAAAIATMQSRAQIPQLNANVPMKVHINLWMFRGMATAPVPQVEVVITAFRFQPLSQQEPAPAPPPLSQQRGQQSEVSTSTFDPPAAVRAEEYLALARAALWRLDDAFAPAGGNNHPGIAACLRGVHYCSEGFQLAAAHALLGTVTSNGSDFAQAARLLTAYASYFQNATRNGTVVYAGRWDFFQCYPVVFAYRNVEAFDASLLTHTTKEAIKNAAASVCQPQMIGVFNQPLSRVVGTVLALQTWPEFDAMSGGGGGGGVWQEWIDTIWSGWMFEESYTENSPVYNSIFLMNLIEFARLRNESNATFGTLNLRSTIARYRDLIGPAATLSAMPSFGDAWDNAGLPCLASNCTSRVQWRHEDAAFWPAVFERAARVFNDGSFRTGAAAYFTTAKLSFEEDEKRDDANGGKIATLPSINAKGVFWLLKARAWLTEDVVVSGSGGVAGAAVVPAAPREVKTRVVYRRQPGAPQTLDKVMLVGNDVSEGGGRSLLLQELYGDAMSHAHPMQKGAIVAFSSRNHTWLKQQGRDNHLVEEASIFMAWESPDAEGDTAAATNGLHLPFRRPMDTMLDGGAYQILEFPTRHMSQPGLSPEVFYLRTFNGLSFIINHKGIDESDAAMMVDSLYVKDIELVGEEGAAKKTFTIANFTSTASAGGELASWAASVRDLPETWGGPRSANLSIHTDGGGGGKALQADVPGAGRATVMLQLNLSAPGPGVGNTFDTREWPTLRITWRLAKDGTFVRRNFAPLFSVSTGPYPLPQPYPGFGQTASSNADFNARQGVGGGAGYAEPVVGHLNWTNAVIANPRFWPRVDAANTIVTLNDSYADVNVTHMHARGTQWRRESVLVGSEGVGALVVLDTFTPAPRMMRGWSVGPLWHLNIESTPTPCFSSSRNCFVATRFNLTDRIGGVTRGSLSLAIAIAASESESESGSGNGDGNTALAVNVTQGFLIGKNVNPFCVFGKRTLQSMLLGKNQTERKFQPPMSVRFLSLLLPLELGIGSAQQQLRRIGVQCAGGGDLDIPCVATLPTPSGALLNVTIGRSVVGGWKVERV